jgi:hypothetical protein
MTNNRNIDDPSRVIDAINYAVIDDTNSPKIPITLELSRARCSRIDEQSFDMLDYQSRGGRRQLLEFLARRGAKVTE